MPPPDETFGARVRRLRKERGWNQKELARRSGLSQPTISDIERGRNRSTGDMVALADALGTTADHLKTGKLTAAQQSRATYTATPVESIYVPVLAVRASAGRGTLMPDREPVVEHIQVTRRWVSMNMPSLTSPQNLAVISAYGDSMVPTFADGDLLMVDSGVNEIKLDAVYVIAKDSELFIKRVQRRLDGSIVLRSDNQVYEPQVIENPARVQLRVVGRVLWVWCGRKL